MKTRTVTVREGELLGPIDFGHDFISYFNNESCPQQENERRCNRCVDSLRQISNGSPSQWQVRCGEYWHDLVAVGMYDGWPWWKPVPHVLIGSTLGSEWEPFYKIEDVRHKQIGGGK